MAHENWPSELTVQVLLLLDRADASVMPGTLVTGRVGGIGRIPAFVLTKGQRERSRSYLPSLWRCGGSPWLPGQSFGA